MYDRYLAETGERVRVSHIANLPECASRIMRKVRVAGGIWKFISLDRIGSRYVWDKRLGHYFLEWWDGKKRCRENAGETPSQALEAQRRKTNELIGEMLTGATRLKPAEEGGTATPIAKALELFTEHVRTHSPAKPATHQRYRQVLAISSASSERRNTWRPSPALTWTITKPSAAGNYLVTGPCRPPPSTSK